MVLKSGIAVRVGEASASCCQRVTCIPSSERLSGEDLFDLVCCFPLQQLGRLSLFIWNFLCLPPSDPHYHPFTSSSSSSSSSYYNYNHNYVDDSDDNQNNNINNDSNGSATLHYAADDDAAYYYNSNSE